MTDASEKKFVADDDEDDDGDSADTMSREPSVLRSLYDENVESHYHAHCSDGYVKPRSYHCT